MKYTTIMSIDFVNSPARLEHPGHLLDVLSLVGHMLPALASPDEIKRVVLEGHVQGVGHLELRVWYPLLFRQLSCSLHLLEKKKWV